MNQVVLVYKRRRKIRVDRQSGTGIEGDNIVGKPTTQGRTQIGSATHEDPGIIVCDGIVDDIEISTATGDPKRYSRWSTRVVELTGDYIVDHSSDH